MEFELNGKPSRFDGDGDTPLLWVIRDEAGLTGTKYGCGIGVRRLHRAHRRVAQLLRDAGQRGGRPACHHHRRAGAGALASGAAGPIARTCRSAATASPAW